MKNVLRVLATAAVLLGVAEAGAQEVNYSWFDLGFMGQDVSRSSTAFDPIGNQTYSFDATDGNGVRFRGSVGTWNNFYAVVDFSSVDPSVSGTVTNNTTGFEAAVDDEFDLTTIRGGIGYKFSISTKMDAFLELTYDSVDFDFGNPVLAVPEFDFDMDDQGVGAALGIRSMLNDDWEVRGHVRYTSVGDADLTSRTFDTDVLFGVGLGYTLIRGLSITADYESGELESYSLGFRLGLDDD